MACLSEGLHARGWHRQPIANTQLALLLCRILATSVIAPRGGLPQVYRTAHSLSGLSRETLTAVLADVSAAIGSGINMPTDAEMLAGRSEAALGSASLVWQFPQPAMVHEQREATSPAFGPANQIGSGATARTFKLLLNWEPLAGGQAANQAANAGHLIFGCRPSVSFWCRPSPWVRIRWGASWRRGLIRRTGHHLR